MRLFTAIELPDPVRDHLARANGRHDPESLHAQHGYRVSSTRAENLHITLKFLGEVDQSTVAGLCDALGKVDSERSEDVWAGHVELLPPRGPVRVIAAGLDGDVGRLELLFRDVEARCGDLGFPRERRTYRPHITLQRCRNHVPAQRRGDMAAGYAADFPGPRFRVDSFALFESRLHADAPQYFRLAHFPLNRG